MEINDLSSRSHSSFLSSPPSLLFPLCLSAFPFFDQSNALHSSLWRALRKPFFLFPCLILFPIHDRNHFPFCPCHLFAIPIRHVLQCCRRRSPKCAAVASVTGVRQREDRLISMIGYGKEEGSTGVVESLVRSQTDLSDGSKIVDCLFLGQRSSNVAILIPQTLFVYRPLPLHAC